MTWLTTPPRRTLVRRWVQAMRIAAEGIEGAIVEDKGMTVALHDRLVSPKQRSRLRRRARRVLAPWVAQGSVSLLRGHRVLEARSSSAGNKGTAVSGCFDDHGPVIVCRSILGTIVRISTHSPWYMDEDLRFESVGGVEPPVKMLG
jgi:Trehalose-6-phosphatase